MSSTCPDCNNSFKNDKGLKIHYGHKHEGTLAETRECGYCKETIKLKLTELDNYKRHFCTKECYDNYQREEGPQGKEHHSYNRIERSCKKCEEIFHEKPSRIANGKGKFCSKKCYSEWQKENSPKGEDHPLWKGNKIEKDCEYCDKKFKIKPHRKDKTRFCSKKCNNEWQSEYLSGENHPHWNGGYENWYGTNWKTQRLKVVERDNGICQVCGIDKETHYEQYDKKIECASYCSYP